MKKYINQRDVIPNHIYKDDKGTELLYLGRANFWDSSQYYDKCIRYIYIRKDILDKYNKDLSLSQVLMDCRRRGLHHFVWSIRPRKLVEEIGVDDRKILKGHIYHGFYNFNFV